MENGEKTKAPAGLLVAIAALVILIAAVSWRFLDKEGGTPPEMASQTGAMSTPLPLDDLLETANSSPDDPEAWQRLAFAYFSRNMFAESVTAYDRATQIAPESAVLWSSLGEARVMASESDPLPAEALQAFRRSVEIDSSDPRARYFLAVEKDLAEDHEGAISDWLALLADTPPGAPWENDLLRTIQQVGTLRDIEVTERISAAAATRNILPAPAAGNVAGPTAQQLAAASRIPPSEQQDMAEDMVARLAARMQSDPGNIEGWIMLMRSYTTLGRESDAQDAYRRGVDANPDAAMQLQSAAEALGIEI